MNLTYEYTEHTRRTRPGLFQLLRGAVDEDFPSVQGIRPHPGSMWDDLFGPEHRLFWRPKTSTYRQYGSVVSIEACALLQPTFELGLGGSGLVGCPSRTA